MAREEQKARELQELMDQQEREVALKAAQKAARDARYAAARRAAETPLTTRAGAVLAPARSNDPERGVGDGKRERVRACAEH